VFWPAPNVDSCLVAVTRRPAPIDPRTGLPGEEPLRRTAFALIDHAFAQRRKTMRAALAGAAGSAASAEARLRAAGIDPGARGEVLGVADFARLAAVWETAPAGSP
jgi:16S rRNA (adenine1518-N6/adenine1519-N6)-dimethyltransferase